MGLLDKFAGRMSLMNEMFGRTGAVSGQNLEDGGVAGLHQAMFRCAKCDSVEECKQFLAASDGPIEPQAFCPNAKFIASMREA